MSGAGEPIELPGGGRALFTDRSHGNLSSVGGEAHEAGLRARERLRRGCGVQTLARGYQVHGTVVARVYADGSRRLAGPAPSGEGALGDLDLRLLADGVDQPRLRADGHAVAASGVGAMVLAADCLPVVLAAEGAVAALHAGWRGLAAGVLEEGVRALRDVGGAGEIVAVVGPGAGACCYEVGAEVHAAFAELDVDLAPPAQGGSRERVGSRGGGPIDLRAIAHRRLLAAGVAAVDDVPGCTVCDERFFSYRREGDAAGRQAGIAWLS